MSRFPALLLVSATLLALEAPHAVPRPSLAGSPGAGAVAVDGAPALSDHVGPDLLAHVARGPAFEGVVQASRHARSQRVAYRRAPEVPEHAGAPGADGPAAPDASGRALLPLAVAGAADWPGIVPAATVEPPARTPTYWRDAMPILRAECASCHTAGGIAPFALDTYTEALQSAYIVKVSMEERFMPPLPADPATSWPIDDPRVMSDADRATLVAWVDAGAPEGDPAEAPRVLPPSDPYGPPSATLDIGVDYTPPADALDDYRCFVIDPGFTTDAELRMVDLEPTNRQMFHHGILYLAEPRLAADARRLDAADPAPGYGCFGGPGFASDEWVAGEAVGALRRPYPAGTAKIIPAGSLFVLQLHYNTNNGIGPDRTNVLLWRAAVPVNRPPRDARMANFLFSIPPGDAEYAATAAIDVVAKGDTRRPSPLRGRVEAGDLWTSWGHMHVLGTSFTLDLIRADGSRVRVLDIPAWDFNWQGIYGHVDPLPIRAGDRLEMRCTWDNSPANQPFIDGRQIEPRTVRWGESTFDEMCLGGVTVTDP